MARRTDVSKAEVDRLADALNRGRVISGPREYRIPLKHPLPHSNTVMGSGGWYTTPWTPRTRAAALANHTRLATEEEYERWRRGF